MHYFNQLLIALCMLLLACVKDKPKLAVMDTPKTNSKQRIFIVNEGNYGIGNASLTYFNPTENTIIEDYYKFQNNTSIGDVLQSMTFNNGKYYLVVNNSAKVLVCDSNLKKLSQIDGLSSPRYFLPITNSKAYVSDLYANQIYVVDLNTNTKATAIACPGWTEHMILHNGKVFVANVKRNYLYVIDALSNQLLDSVSVGLNVSGLVKDKENQLWIMSGGDKSKSIWPQLTKVDAANIQSIHQYTFTTNDEPSQLCLNKTKDTLYYLNKGICRMTIHQNVLPTLVFIPQNNRNYYGLGINPYDYTIYASDALEYIQKSNCYVFSANGQQINLFKAGINANAFYFE